MILFLTILVETLVLALMNGLMIENTWILVSFMIVNLFFIYLDIKTRDKTYILIYTLAYTIRVIIMLLDIYGKDYIQIIGSGADTVAYFRIGKQVAADMTLFTQRLRATPYTNLLGFLINLVGPNRIFLQYLNIIFFMQTLNVVDQIMTILEFDKKYKHIGLLFITLFPSSIVYSSILLREQLIILLSALSLKNFIKWFYEKKLKNFIYSIIFIVIATSLHAGIIGMFLIYLIYYFYFMRKNDSSIITNRMSGIFLIILLILILLNKDFLFNRLIFKDMNDLLYKLNISNKNVGESVYLSNITFTNPLQIILYSPIKLFYFLYSPIIFDWRGISDIVAFMFDTVFYIISTVSIIKYWKYYKHDNDITVSLICMIIVTALIFAMGTVSSGTAMRHRNKLSIMIMLVDLKFYQESKLLRKV